jgi:putative ABC transport system permease protein
VLSLALALRAVRWRAAASATVFAVALIGIAAGAVGPIYLHAVDQTVLAHRLTQAPQSKRDLRITRETTVGDTRVNWKKGIVSLASAAADPRWFDPPVYSENAPMTWQGHVGYTTELAALDGLCAHVHVVSGRCVAARPRPETVVTARTAKAQHLHVGQLLTPHPADTADTVSVRLVGIVAPIDAHGSFWSPWPYLNAATSAFTNQPPRLDAFFVSAEYLADQQQNLEQILSANLRLRADRIRIDDVGPLRARIIAVQDAAAHSPSVSALSIPNVGSGLPGVLNAMQSEMTRSRALVVLATAQLVLLAIGVLYAVVAGTTAATGNEVALAKLRGRRTRSVLAQGLAQPVLLVLLAAPIAALLAWVVIKSVAGGLLGTAAGVTFPLSALVVVLVVTAASLVAAAVAARRIFLSPVGQLLRRGTDAAGSRVGLLLVDVGTLALAAAAVLEIGSTGTDDAGRTNPLSAVAAIMLGAGIGVLVVRALPVLGRAVVRATRESPRLASYLAVRQIVRRPAGARVIVLVGVAVALATFAVIGWSVASTNRDVRAAGQAGAHTVFYVRPTSPTVDVRAAVDAADPSGNSMAAAVVQVARGTPLLAVDTARFAGVAAWAAHNDPQPLHTLLSTLRAAAAPSVVVPGPVLRVATDTTALPARSVVTVSAAFTGADHVGVSRTLGTLHVGRQSLRTTLSPMCTAPCRITQLSVRARPAGKGGTASATAEIDTTLTATGARSGTGGASRPTLGFGDPLRWRPDDTGLARLTAGDGGGLGLQLRPDSSGSWPTVFSRDTPSSIPAVVSSGTASTYTGNSIRDVTSFGLDSAPLSLNGFSTALSLPVLDRTGVLIDLHTAVLEMRAGLSAQAQYAVFASASAPGDLARRLHTHGLVVTRTVTAASYRNQLDHTGPALADGLFLVAAGAATLLAIGATVLGGVVTARRRAYELAALEAAGVARRTLRTATVVEQVVLLLSGLLVGVVAGVIGARLALPSMPMFVDQSIGPPITRAIPLALLGEFVIAAVLVFVLTAGVIAGVVSRQATASRLREAQT